MSTTSAASNFQKIVVPILLTIATGMSTAVFTKLDRLETDVRQLLIAQGIDRTEIDNMKRQLDRDNNEPRKTSCISEPTLFTLPDNKEVKSRKFVTFQ